MLTTQIFWPFVGWFRSDVYVSALYIGESMTGVVSCMYTVAHTITINMPSACKHIVLDPKFRFVYSLGLYYL